MPINVAQIGVGYWGPNLLRNFVLSTEFSVKAVIDLSEDRRIFVKNQYPAILVDSDSDSVFNDPEIEAVVIATPVSTHYDLAMRAIKQTNMCW